MNAAGQLDMSLELRGQPNPTRVYGMLHVPLHKMGMTYAIIPASPGANASFKPLRGGIAWNAAACKQPHTCGIGGMATT